MAAVSLRGLTLGLGLGGFFDGIVLHQLLQWHHMLSSAELPARLLAGGLLVGWGPFNLTEGLIDPFILRVHHVNGTVPPSLWIYGDVGFLVWGAAMPVGVWTLLRPGASDSGDGGAG